MSKAPVMEEIVSPASKLVGEVVVPGERAPAERALVLAALGAEKSVLRNVPVSADRVVALLRGLGIGIDKKKNTYTVKGGGLRGFKAVDEPIELDGLGNTASLLLTVLAGQSFTSRVKLGDEVERCRQLIDLLLKLGFEIQRETGTAFAVGGSEPHGHVYDEVDLEQEVKLAVMVGALYAEGVTQLPETASNRNRMERFLRGRGVEVERRREGAGFVVSVAGGQAVGALDVEVPGQLALSYPLLGAALCRKGSKLTVKRVAIHAGQRAFLDLLRQIGGKIDIEDLGEGEHDLHVRPSELKSTRVAGQRTAKVIDQIALLAVLATQAGGEIVIRDIEVLRNGAFDYVGHLFESLRAIEARVGEFPEGLVVKGGVPMMAGRLDSKGDPDLVMAFAVAGLLAEGGEMTIGGTQCMDSVWPDFFKTLHLLKETKR